MMSNPTNGTPAPAPNGGDGHKIRLQFTYSNGWPGEIEVVGISAANVGGKLASITQALESAGCRPPAPPVAAANGTPAPTNGGYVAPPPAGAAAPICKYHGVMSPSKKVSGGYYCPAKMGDGSYCQEQS